MRHSRWVATKRAKELERHTQLEAGLQNEATVLATELRKTRMEYEAKLRAAQEDKELALHRQLVELTGSAEERMALQAEQEKQARVELLRRQFTRRMMHRELSAGWSAWHEQWDARSRALSWLREAGNRLRKPAIFSAFKAWCFQWEWARRSKAQLAERARAAGMRGDYVGLLEEVKQLREKVFGKRRRCANADPHSPCHSPCDSRSCTATRAIMPSYLAIVLTRHHPHSLAGGHSRRGPPASHRRGEATDRARWL